MFQITDPYERTSAGFAAILTYACVLLCGSALDLLNLLKCTIDPYTSIFFSHFPLWQAGVYLFYSEIPNKELWKQQSG